MHITNGTLELWLVVDSKYYEVEKNKKFSCENKNGHTSKTLYTGLNSVWILDTNEMGKSTTQATTTSDTLNLHCSTVLIKTENLQNERFNIQIFVTLISKDSNNNKNSRIHGVKVYSIIFVVCMCAVLCCIVMVRWFWHMEKLEMPINVCVHDLGEVKHKPIQSIFSTYINASNR